MKAYIRLKINNINITYEKLGKQIWGVPGKNPWFNHFGDGESFRKELDIGLGILPTDFNEKWKDTHKGWGPVMINVKKMQDRPELLVITDFIEELPYNQKAFYNMTYYVATHVGGMITDRNRQEWITPDEFKKLHQSIMEEDFNQLLYESIVIGKKETPGAEEPDVDDVIW